MEGAEFEAVEIQSFVAPHHVLTRTSRPNVHAHLCGMLLADNPSKYLLSKLASIEEYWIWGLRKSGSWWVAAVSHKSSGSVAWKAVFKALTWGWAERLLRSSPQHLQVRAGNNSLKPPRASSSNCRQYQAIWWPDSVCSYVTCLVNSETL